MFGPGINSTYNKKEWIHEKYVRNLYFGEIKSILLFLVFHESLKLHDI